jgi:hypothetical protein
MRQCPGVYDDEVGAVRARQMNAIDHRPFVIALKKFD